MKNLLVFLCIFPGLLCGMDRQPASDSCGEASSSAAEASREREQMCLTNSVINALQNRDEADLRRLLYDSHLHVLPKMWLSFMQQAIQIGFGQKTLWEFVTEKRNKMVAFTYFCAAVEESDLSIVGGFLDDPSLCALCSDYSVLQSAFQESAWKGRNFVVRAMLCRKLSAITRDVEFMALKGAVIGGRTKIVEEFLKYPDKIKVRDCAKLVKTARKFEHEDIAFLLSNYVSASSCCNVM